jgi:ADP-ribosylglycohydrolase
LGDALCLGSHWIYSLQEIAEKFPGGIVGFEAPPEGHYHAGKKPGDFTHYGDAALLMLQSLAETGRFSPQDFGSRFVSLFSSPQYHGYRDHATKETLANYRPFAEQLPENPYHFQGGADDDQPATATRLAPVVVAHLKDDNLLRVVQSATQVCQNNSRAVAYMKCHALLLKSLLTGASLEAGVRSAAQAVVDEPEYGREIAQACEAALGKTYQEVTDATLELGQSCPLKSSFPAALQAALKFQDQPRAALLAAANAGGDSAARCAMIGSWLGALHGVQGLPQEWRERIKAKEEIERCTNRILERLGQ